MQKTLICERGTIIDKDTAVDNLLKKKEKKKCLNQETTLPQGKERPTVPELRTTKKKSEKRRKHCRDEHALEAGCNQGEAND